MFIKMYFVFAIVFVSPNLLAQNYSMDSYKNNPNYEVKILEDSTIEINDKAKNYRWLKSIEELPVYDNATEANLIISLDTVNFMAYEGYYRYWGTLPTVNSYGKFIAVDANKNGKNEIYSYSIQYDQDWFFYQPRIYNQVIDSLFTQTYSFPDTGGPFFDIGDITYDGLLDLIFAGFTGLKFY